MDRVETHRNEYESWPYSIKDAVLSGQVLRGMDPTMVLVARGNPTERVDQGNGDEIWVYPAKDDEGKSPSRILPRGTQISVGGGSPGYPGGMYPGAQYPYPGGGYPGGGGSGIYVPPIVLGGGGSQNNEPANEDQIVFRNGRVSSGDGVK